MGFEGVEEGGDVAVEGEGFAPSSGKISTIVWDEARDRRIKGHYALTYPQISSPHLSLLVGA